MSYRDPQRAIDQTYTVLAQGLEKFYANISSSIGAFLKKKKEDEIAAQKALNKRLNTGMNPFLKEYNKTIKDAAKFSSGMGDEGAVLEEQITWNLETIREQLKKEVIALGVDATESQIRGLSNKALSDATKLHGVIEKWGEARTEYAETAGLEPNQVNALVPTRNTGLMGVVGKFVDDDDHNMFLYNTNFDKSKGYTLGNASWNVATYDGKYNWKTGVKSDDFNMTNDIDINSLQRDPTDDSFFNHVQEFDPKKEYSTIHGVIDNFIKTNNPDYVTEVDKDDERAPIRGGTMKDKARYVVNKGALKEYLTTDPAGKGIMHTYTDDEDAFGHWQQMGEMDDVNPATNTRTWSTHEGGTKPYSEAAYWDVLIDRAIENYRYE